MKKADIANIRNTTPPIKCTETEQIQKTYVMYTYLIRCQVK